MEGMNIDLHCVEQNSQELLFLIQDVIMPLIGIGYILFGIRMINQCRSHFGVGIAIEVEY
jgi:hypothetical protein